MGPARPGRKIVISGDTTPCEALRVAAHEADLLIHEATFAEEEADRAAETGHSTAGQAAAIAREAEVRMLALTHLSTRYPVGVLRDEARAVFADDRAADGTSTRSRSRSPSAGSRSSCAGMSAKYAAGMRRTRGRSCRMSDSSRDRVQTERLTCERLALEHAPELLILLGDPRVARTMFADGRPLSEAGVLDGLHDKLEHWERYGFGPWLLRDRASGAMVGRGGLQHTFVDGNHEIEVGWAIVPERWGQGLATELAHASVALAFDDLGLDEIVAFTLPDNVASRRVMEKAGFVFQREIVHTSLDHVLYRRTAETTCGLSRDRGGRIDNMSHSTRTGRRRLAERRGAHDPRDPRP